MSAQSHPTPPAQYGDRRALFSPAAQTLLLFWVLLGVIALLPSSLKETLLTSVSSIRGSSSVPGLPRTVTPPPEVEPPTAATPHSGGAPTTSAPPDAAAAKTDVQAIEDPGRSMAHFYEALRRTAAKKAGAVTRVLHYGDSLIDMDRITGPLRRRLHKQYGDAGHGFVLGSKPWRWYTQQGITVSEPGGKNSGWRHLRLVGGRAGGDGRLGLGLAAAEPEKRRAVTQINFSERVASKALELHYLKQPGGGRIDVTADGAAVRSISTKNDTKLSGFIELSLQKPARVLRLIARGRVRMFGVNVTRPGPGVIWHNFPLVAARFHQLALLNAAHWAEQLQHATPNLVLFQFGANDTVSYGGDLAAYARRVGVVLARVRKAVPEASCMVIGPLDRVQKDRRGRLRSPKVVRTVAEAQRKVTLAAGCAFWDGQLAMGGAGAMAKWSKRGLARRDMVHLNRKGSKVMADLLHSALEAGLKAHRPAKP